MEQKWWQRKKEVKRAGGSGGREGSEMGQGIISVAVSKSCGEVSGKEDDPGKICGGGGGGGWMVVGGVGGVVGRAVREDGGGGGGVVGGGWVGGSGEEKTDVAKGRG